MCGGLYHSSLQVCIAICGAERAVIQLCALHAKRWSHIKTKDFSLRALSLSSSPSVQQFDGQLKPKFWLTAADPRVITHDRESLGSGSLFQKSSEEGPVCMCVEGHWVRTDWLSHQWPHKILLSLQSPDCMKALRDVYITKERWCECSDVQCQM